MNIDYANTIPLRIVFDKICLQPEEKEGHKLTYYSPFRKDSQASLNVNTETNKWQDTTDKTRGNVVTFVCLYLKSIGKPYRVKDALDWLKDMVGYVVLNCPDNLPSYVQENKKYRYKDHGMVTSPSLIHYLEQDRGIPLDYARFLLREIRLLNTETGKSFSALGMANDEGGIAIRNPFVKANVRPLYISFIRGKQVKPDGIHIFKDFFDYLSILTKRHGKPFDDDVIILNCLSMMKLSSAFIRSYGYKHAYAWLDNTDIGTEATKRYAAFFQTEPGLVHHAMNRHYQGYKDVNEWHVAQLC